MSAEKGASQLLSTIAIYMCDENFEVQQRHKQELPNPDDSGQLAFDEWRWLKMACEAELLYRVSTSADRFGFPRFLNAY
ncbi:hypothetical protein AFLA_000347 [Aspergillus flavus NRRL3357]|nr:hypothetical protein AFLA_000347 [Aspergillus flavus NRRL3357]